MPSFCISATKKCFHVSLSHCVCVFFFSSFFRSSQYIRGTNTMQKVKRIAAIARNENPEGFEMKLVGVVFITENGNFAFKLMNWFYSLCAFSNSFMMLSDILKLMFLCVFFFFLVLLTEGLNKLSEFLPLISLINCAATM